MINLLSKPFIIGVLVVAAILAQAIMLRTAYNSGAAAQLSENRRVTIEQLKERSETDAEIREMDDDELCVLLGGSVSDDGECL